MLAYVWLGGIGKQVANFRSITGVAALEIAGKPFGAQGLVSSMRPQRYWTIPRAAVDSVFDNMHDLLNFFVLEFQRILFVENIFTTLAVSFECYKYSHHKLTVDRLS